MTDDLKHTVHMHHHHCAWDNSLPPVMTVSPGSMVTFETMDASGGQITPGSTIADVATLDFSRINPVTGPIFVDGARPGDALKITLLGYRPSGWGWTANVPGFGLLADQFPDPALHLWTYDPDRLEPAMFGPGGKVPLKPFAGTIGLAPGASGSHSIVPPRRVGGNMDIRDLSVGTELFLPVEVPGALFSIGDPHAAQGDGEVCGTAIESPMQVTVKLELIRGMALRGPQFITPGPVSRHKDELGFWVTTGIGDDLMEGARTAVAAMIDELTQAHGMSAVDAYMLCSVCADLKISEIVDVPNFVVSLYFPRLVFD